MENQSHAFVAGLFVIVFGLLALGVAAWLGSQKGPAGAPVDLLTTHSVAGLKAGAPVRFRGVDVGRVDSIAFDPQQLGQIRVRISVDRAAPLTNTTYAKLSYQGINGVALIQLDDDPRKHADRLLLGATKLTQMELQAGLLERAEDDVRDVLLKAAHVAVRIDDLLSEDNQKRLMALVDTLQRTSKRYETLGQEFEPSAKAVPILLQQATVTVARAREVVDAATHLAADTDRKLVALDTVAQAARHLTQVADDLHTDTLPRVQGLADEVASDARELKQTLHQVNARPQSFIFGLQPSPPGPGEPGFAATARAPTAGAAHLGASR